MLTICVCMCYFLGVTAGRDTAEVDAGLTCTYSRGRENWTDGETRGGGREDQRTYTPDSKPYTTGLHPFANPGKHIYYSNHLYSILSYSFYVPMQLSDLKRQSEEVNSAVEVGEEARRKLQRELENATQREKAKEEEKERIERQKERLREEIEDMTIALQRERQNCTALEKRQKKFDQVL